jgi:hypothetical protein
VSVVEAGAQAAIEAPAPDGYYWFLPWANRLVSLRDAAVAQTERPATQGRFRFQVSAPAKEQLIEASERLELWIEQCDEYLGPETEDPLANGLSARSGPLVPRMNQWLYCVADGGDSELSIDLAPVAANPNLVRLVGAAAIVCLAAASVWIVRRPAATDVFYQWPHAMSFLVGMAYWAWLWPSWVGIVISIASLLLAWRSGWPGRSLPLERSTVIRVPKSDVVAT